MPVGDFRGARALREEFQNRVYLCYFRQDRKNDEVITWKDEDGTVSVDRNKMIQTIVDEFVERRMPVYGSEEDWFDYLNEWLGMYRTVEDNAMGIPIFVWNKPSSGRADYPFCQVYVRVGLDRFSESAATSHEPRDNSFAFLDREPTGRPGFLPKR